VRVATACVHIRRFIVHRQLSTCSFYVDVDLVVQLGNFARARAVVDDEYIAETHESVVINLAAPEVLRHLIYSTKSDVWALAVVFWQVPHHKYIIPFLFVFVTLTHLPLSDVIFSLLIVPLITLPSVPGFGCEILELYKVVLTNSLTIVLSDKLTFFATVKFQRVIPCPSYPRLGGLSLLWPL